MGTRAHVGVLTATGTVQSIECVMDSYPETIGPQLLRFAPTLEHAQELVRRGDMDTANRRFQGREDWMELSDKPRFDEKTKRDMEEMGLQARTLGPCIEHSMASWPERWTPDRYLFVPKKGWQVWDEDNLCWRQLTESWWTVPPDEVWTPA